MHPREVGRPWFQRFAGVCGIPGSVLPLAMVLSATFLSSWFSWSENALSELGVGSQALLFNTAMWIGGILNTVFSLGLYQSFKGWRLMRAGAALLMASSLCLGLVGIFTVDQILLHGIAAIGYFILAPIGIMTIGYGSKGNTTKKLSLACGTSALLAILVLPFVIFTLPFKLGFAVPELI